MELKTAQITNFRCIDDSQKFSLGRVTCLVGKNESGKTAILHALERLNPYDKKSKYEKLADYPRRLLPDFDDAHPDGKSPAVETEWELSPEDVSAVEGTLGAKSLKTRSVTVSSGFGFGQTWTVPVDETAVIKHILSEAGCSSQEKGQFGAIKSVKELVATISAEEQRSEALNAVLALVGKFRDGSPVRAAIDILAPRMPTFVYFGNYDRMNGNVSIDSLRTKIQTKQPLDKEDEIFLDFLAFAGTSVDELAGVTKYEDLKARVEGASIKISNQIFDYWSQNRNLRVQFSLDAAKPGDPPPYNTGNIMRTRIWNNLHEMTVDFNERSTGFVWFFSFLVYFSQVEKSRGNVIILLDEPGLSLHAKAQEDLLRYIDDKLQPKHQVIYTTHSPFMVPTRNLERVRTVEDVVEYPEDRTKPPKVLGTKVGDDVLSTDRDTLFPLQGALGYEITQSLFIGPNTLLVEGPSDILYIQTASDELARRKRVGLDRRWTVCPSGGIDKVSAFVSLFGGNKLNIAVLTDIAVGDKAKIANLRKSKLLADEQIFTAADFCGQPEADTEDFFGPALYAEIVNNGFGLSGALKIDPAKITPGTRVVKGVAGLFAVMPPGSPEFDHYTPARWLLSNTKILEGASAEVTTALDRFETLFKKLNALLPAHKT